MGLRPTSPATNGAGRRKCQSWLESFAEQTDNLEAPRVFRHWAAVCTLASVMEQKVSLKTSSTPLFPNLYVVLVGHPGTGKTRSIREARRYLGEVEEFHMAPVSFTFSALVDALSRAKRTIIQPPREALEYNSIMIAADELGTFMHKLDREMAAGLSALYDPDPYGHERRGKELRIKIKSPQVNMLCGVTPEDLMETMPESAWGQGLMSRTIMVFSDERIIGDDFAPQDKSLSKDLIHDLKLINAMTGQYLVTEEYRDLVNKWRREGEKPHPTHPKLLHYNTRRKVNLFKLSMIAAVDKSDALLLTKEDFFTALGWLEDIERFMADPFKAGATSTDSKVMDEVYHFVMVTDPKRRGVHEQMIVDFAKDRVPVHSVQRLIEVMVSAGMLQKSRVDDMTGTYHYRAIYRQPAHAYEDPPPGE